MDQDFQIDPNVPEPGENPDELKDTVSWIINVVLKVGAGYLARTIMELLDL